MTNVQVRGGYVLHVGRVEGVIRKGDYMKQLIDEVSLIFATAGCFVARGYCFADSKEADHEEPYGNARSELRSAARIG